MDASSLLTSSDSGATWSNALPAALSFLSGFSSIAMSADGTSLIGAGGTVYLFEAQQTAQAPQIRGFSDQVTAQARYTGVSASLDVVAQGTQPLSYQWQFGGTNIPGANDPVLHVEPAIATGEGGVEYCQWYFGTNVPGPDTVAYEIIPGATNAFFNETNPATASSTSGFQVVVTNAFGSVTSAVARVEVLAPPPTAAYVNDTVSDEPDQGELGSMLTFSVGAAGTPPITYQWLFNGAILLGQTNSSLTITNAQASGLYAVAVSNSIGGGITDFPFTLEIPPPSFLAWQLPALLSQPFLLSWTTLTGQTYKLQFSTDLSRTNWTDLVTGLTATNGVLSATDVMGTNSQRFYRAALER